MMRQAIWVLGIFLIFLAAPAFAFDKVFDHTYPLPKGGTFTLENVNGSVQVVGWERDEVEVRAVKTARRNAADLDRVQIDVEGRPDAVSVRTRYPQESGVDVAVDYEVRVPFRVLLGGVATVNGSIRVRGVEGSGRLRSVNGNVEVFDSVGRFSARTTNGNLHLELQQLPDGDPMAIETVNGSVLLAVPPNAGATLNVHTMNGDFRSEVPVISQGSFSTRAFHGQIGSGGGEISIRTVNGRIRVVLERPSV
jgi:hypothetical protein